MKTTLWMAAMVSVVCVMTVSGTDKIWQGTSGANWTTGANWVGGAAPANDTTTDRAVFTTGSSGSVNVDADMRSVGGVLIQRDIAFAGLRLVCNGSTGLVVNAGCSVTCSNEFASGTFNALGDGSTLTCLSIVNSGGTFNMTNATINFTKSLGFSIGATFSGSGVVNYASTETNNQAALKLAFNDNVRLVYKSQASDPVNNNNAYFRFQGTNTLLLEKDANLTVSNSASIGSTSGPMVLWSSTTTTVSGAHALTISQLNVVSGTSPSLMLDGATLNIGDGGGIAEGVYSSSTGGGSADVYGSLSWTLAATTNGGTMRVKNSPLGSNFNPNGGQKGGKIIVGTNATLISNCTWTNRNFTGGDNTGLQVNEGATLGGTGMFVMGTTPSGYYKTTLISGHVAPGDGGIGTLTISCTNLTWNSVSTNGSKWVWDLGNGNAADKLYIDGVFTKGTGSKFFFDLHNATRPGTFVLVEWTSNTTFGVSDFAALNGSGNDTFAIVGKQLQLTVPARGTSIIIK
jgi:hypothetical protein